MKILLIYREPYQNVNRWFTTIINQPQVKNVIGEIKICEQVAQIDPKKFHETQKQSQGIELVFKNFYSNSWAIINW